MIQHSETRAKQESTKRKKKEKKQTEEVDAGTNLILKEKMNVIMCS